MSNEPESHDPMSHDPVSHDPMSPQPRHSQRDAPGRGRRRLVLSAAAVLTMVAVGGIAVFAATRPAPGRPVAAVLATRTDDRASRDLTRPVPTTTPPAATTPAPTTPAPTKPAAPKTTKAAPRATAPKVTTSTKKPAPAPAGCSSYSGNQRVACTLLPGAGFSTAEMPALIQLWDHESGWSTSAANPSGAYGIPQALPGSKMATAGSDWRTSAATQIRWGLGYIAGRYGSPTKAWAYWQNNGWY